MVRGQVEFGQKICPQYASLYIGDHKVKGERLLANLDGVSHSAETLYVGAIGSLEFFRGRASESLLWGGGDDGKKRSSIN